MNTLLLIGAALLLSGNSKSSSSTGTGNTQAPAPQPTPAGGGDIGRQFGAFVGGLIDEWTKKKS